MTQRKSKKFYWISFFKIVCFVSFCTNFIIASQSLDDDLSFSFDEVSSTDVGTPKPTEPAQPQAPREEELALTMDFPVIGTISLIPFTEKDASGKEVSGLKTYIPKKDTKLVLGPLTLDKGELRLINNEPSLKGSATLFGFETTLTIKKAEGQVSEPEKNKIPSFSRVILNAAFIKPATLELLPEKKVVLSNVSIVLEKQKPVEIVAGAVVLGQPVDFTFSVSKLKTDVWAEFKSPLKISSIVPGLKSTVAENISLNSFKITAHNFVSKKDTVTYDLEGKADISQIPGLGQSAAGKEIVMSGEYDPKKGAVFTMTTQQLSLPSFGILEDAKIVADSTQKPLAVTASGKARVAIPNVGDFETVIDAKIKKEGIEITGTLAQTVRVADIELKNVALSFSSVKKELSLTGQGLVKGYQSKLTVTKDVKNNVKIYAALLEKEMRPFGTTPGLSDFTLKNPIISFEKRGVSYQSFMEGTVTIFGVPLHGELRVEKGGTQDSVLLLAKAPADWKLSDGMPQMKGTLFDQILLNELVFVISNQEYRDTEKSVSYKKGLNFVAKTTLSGPLVPVADFTNSPKESVITISGYLAPDPLNSIFRAAIPSGVVLKNDSVTLGKLELEIAGKPIPSFSLLTTLMVKPSPQDDPLNLTGRIKIQSPPLNAELSGTMQGFWSRPFGINNLEIGNIAAEIAFGPPFPTTGIPASIGLAGQFMLGQRNVAVALKIPLAGSADTVLCGALDKLTLEDVVSVAAQMANKNDREKLTRVKLPEVGIEDMKIYIAPKDTMIGELSFNKGLTVRGAIYVPGFKAFGNVTVSTSGLIAQASCTEIKYGPQEKPLLLVTRAREDKTFQSPTKVAFAKKAPSLEIATAVDATENDDLFDFTMPEETPAVAESKKVARKADVACAPDSKMMTEFNGPTMRIVLNLEQDLSKQGILVSGLFKVAEIFEQDSYLRMDMDGIEFNFQTALGKAAYKDKPLLQTMINGKSSGELSNPDFRLILDFQQYLLSYIKDEARAAIKKAKEDVGKGIAAARKESDEKIGQAQKQSNEAIDKAKEEVEKARQSLNVINEQIDKIKSSMKDAIENAGKNRLDLEIKIKQLDEEIAQAKSACKL